MKKETIIKKAVMVTFENYYSREQKQLVTGTVSTTRAIKAVKDEQCERKCDVKKTEVLKNIKVSDIRFDMDYAIKL